jgi:uncharacterized protein YwgA
MDAKEFVTLTLLVTGGEIRGNTKLQKTVYFLGLMTGKLEELGYRAHFYGPYSDEVASAVTELKTIGAVDQNVTDWGYDRSGFEVRRYEYRLNEPGKQFAKVIASRNAELWQKMQAAHEVYRRAGDKDYMTLSIAAKTYFILGQKKAPATDAELANLASKFGWTVTVEQVRQAATYLGQLGLVEPVHN